MEIKKVLDELYSLKNELNNEIQSLQIKLDSCTFKVGDEGSKLYGNMHGEIESKKNMVIRLDQTIINILNS